MLNKFLLCCIMLCLIHRTVQDKFYIFIVINMASNTLHIVLKFWAGHVVYIF